MKKAIEIVIAAAVLMTGCITDSGGNKNNTETWLNEHGGEIVNYAYTKADIEAEIEAKWQEYGYKEKPVKYIAISFDDGPCSASSYGGTAALLAKLDELKVKATFFVIGQNVRANKAAAQAIFNGGHELGNHSDGYGSLGELSTNSIAASLDAASLTIKEITGKYPCLFRAPNLNHGENLSKVCGERGMALIDGNVHSDWDGTGHTSTSIKNSVLFNPQNGGIILLHENNTSKGDTLNALPDIINGLREKGFWIMTVGQLAAVKEKPLEAGKRYSSII
jgi:peptidoglycan/xylan/chitin deacetylase (PgdA/CDA1 family)